MAAKNALKVSLFAAVWAVPLLLASGSVFAQTAPADQTQEAEEDSPIEITVFAQKREQKLQDVPIQVSAFGSTILNDAGVKDIKDLTVLTPGLLVTSTTSETVTTARVRGVGTVGDNPGLESSVGVIIDGVFRPRNGVGFNDLGELERIEVLKGPQGTLFGKNTSSGLIQIFSAKPKFDWGTNAEFTVGEEGTFGGSGSITGPLIEDKLAVRIYGAVRSRNGLTDVVRGAGPRAQDQDTDQSFASFRGQILWTPVDRFDFRLIGDYTSRNENCCVATAVASINPTAGANATAVFIDALAGGQGTGHRAGTRTLDPGFGTFDRVAFSNRGTEQAIREWGISGESTLDVGFAKLIGLLSYRDWEVNNGQDSDFTATDIFYRPFNGDFGNEFKTFSAELRAQGEAFSGRFNWVVGGFYANEDLQRRDTFLYGTANETYFSLLLSGGQNPNEVAGITGLAPGQSFRSGFGLRDVYDQTTNSYAAFSQVSWKIVESLEFTGGVRFTSDNKDLNVRFSNTDNGAACGAVLTRVGAGVPLPAAAVGLICLPFNNPRFNGQTLNNTRSDNQVTGTAKIAWKPIDNILFFGGYSRGFKAGGFNLDREQTPTFAVDRDLSFAEETVNAYEVGTKTTWFNGSLLLNATGFFNNFQGFQLNTFLGTTFVVQSIPEVTSRGFDFDALWATPIDGLTLQGGITIANTRYGDFGEFATINGVRTLVFSGSTTPIPSGLALLPGNKLSFAPLVSSSFGFSYERNLFQKLLVRLSLNGRYTSAYSTASDLLRAKDQPAFTLFNGRFGISTPDERFTVEFFANNLFDKSYIQVGFNGPFQGASGVTNTGPNAGIYNPNLDTISYYSFLGPQRIAGVSAKFKY